MSVNPYTVVDLFEKEVAEFTGAKYGVAVESCSAAIFLSLQYCMATKRVALISEEMANRPMTISMPKYSYPSVPCSIIHSGNKVKFTDEGWSGEYELKPLDIWDSALRFKRGMYHGGLQCISFHAKKLLPIGRGGMILTDSAEARDWLRRARFDGRRPVPLQEDYFDMLGWNAYLEPSQAARGLQLMQALLSKYPDGPEDLKVEDQKYCDLSRFKIYQQ